MVISVLFSILGLTLGVGLIIDFVSVRDGLIIAPTQHYSMFRQAHVAACKSS